jgi:hypothetical protein
MPPIHRQPLVDIRKTEVVERNEKTLLLRFEYYFCRPSGLSVHGRALEFAELEQGYWKIRRDRFSALRGGAPPFHGKQLPQVYLALQTAVDASL